MPRALTKKERVPTSTEPRSTVRINLRCTPAQKRAILRCAKAYDLTLADFILMRIALKPSD